MNHGLCMHVWMVSNGSVGTLPSLDQEVSHDPHGMTAMSSAAPVLFSPTTVVSEWSG